VIVASDEVERPALDFVEHSAKILPKNPDEKELDAAEE